MAGGVRFVIVFSSLFLLVAAVVARGNPQSSTSSSSTSSLPKTDVKLAIDMFHGTKVLDNYRWLEDGNSPADAEVGGGGDGLHPRRARSVWRDARRFISG